MLSNFDKSRQYSDYDVDAINFRINGCFITQLYRHFYFEKDVSTFKDDRVLEMQIKIPLYVKKITRKVLHTYLIESMVSEVAREQLRGNVRLRSAKVYPFINNTKCSVVIVTKKYIPSIIIKNLSKELKKRFSVLQNIETVAAMTFNEATDIGEWTKIPTLDATTQNYKAQISNKKRAEMDRLQKYVLPSEYLVSPIRANIPNVAQAEVRAIDAFCKATKISKSHFYGSLLDSIKKYQEESLERK